MDMPLCSRRAWKTPAGFTTWPTPDCYYDDGAAFHVFNPDIPDRTTAGVYHDNRPRTATDAALRGLLLSRHNRVRWLTFIPALTTGSEATFGAWFENFTRWLRLGSAPDTTKEFINACAGQLARYVANLPPVPTPE